MSLGLQLTKIHKVLKFTQKDWLRPYIEFNTEKRKKAFSKFGENQEGEFEGIFTRQKSFRDALISIKKSITSMSPTHKSIKTFLQRPSGIRYPKLTLSSLKRALAG